jgi:pimeloyl-ACP methyl ester carboxylesterase
VASPSAWERLEQIAVPTFVVWGTLDFPHIRRRMAQLVARVRGARSLVIDGVAHLPNLEAPGTFDEGVGAFLASSGMGHRSG